MMPNYANCPALRAGITAADFGREAGPPVNPGGRLLFRS